MSDYSDIADAIRVAEERAEAGFVGCVTVRLDTLKLWRARMLIAAEREPQGAPEGFSQPTRWCSRCKANVVYRENYLCRNCSND